MSIGLCDKRTTARSGFDPRSSYTAVGLITAKSQEPAMYVCDSFSICAAVQQGQERDRRRPISGGMRRLGKLAVDCHVDLQGRGNRCRRESYQPQGGLEQWPAAAERDAANTEHGVRGCRRLRVCCS